MTDEPVSLPPTDECRDIGCGSNLSRLVYTGLEKPDGRMGLPLRRRSRSVARPSLPRSFLRSRSRSLSLSICILKICCVGRPEVDDRGELFFEAGLCLSSWKTSTSDRLRPCDFFTLNTLGIRSRPLLRLLTAPRPRDLVLLMFLPRLRERSMNP
jgi:hypothetical protein